MIKSVVRGTLFIAITIANTATANDVVNNELAEFGEQVMYGKAIMPSDLTDKFISCPIESAPNKKTIDYRSAQQVDYQLADWEKRIGKNWQFFSASKDEGKLLVIDFANNRDGLSYRYLANDNTQDTLYEPWSSSKVMAFTLAAAKARKQTNGKLGADSTIDGIPLADLITTVHSYSHFGQSTSTSNAIATYFLNLVGRENATRAFHQDWLKLANKKVRYRGAYETEMFKPSDKYWVGQQVAVKTLMPDLAENTDDKFYQAYRCEACGLTGNKPMTTLAEAEWLKRLASHEREGSTRHPHLLDRDIEVLFYGKGHSDTEQQVGGMMQGEGTILADAIADAIADDTNKTTKQILDEATNGQWRIFQKLGAGDSETRQAGEHVILAHVCLPEFKGGVEFTLAAQTAVSGYGKAEVYISGKKMQKLLKRSMKELLQAK